MATRPIRGERGLSRQGLPWPSCSSCGPNARPVCPLAPGRGAAGHGAAGTGGARAAAAFGAAAARAGRARRVDAAGYPVPARLRAADPERHPAAGRAERHAGRRQAAHRSPYGTRQRPRPQAGRRRGQLPGAELRCGTSDGGDGDVSGPERQTRSCSVDLGAVAAGRAAWAGAYGGRRPRNWPLEHDPTS